MGGVIRASEFVRSIGVNVHLNGHGANEAPDFVGALSYLGVENIRTGANASMLGEDGLLSRFADAGFRFDIVLPGMLAPQATVAALTDFALAHGLALSAIEGPNEVNHFPIRYGSLTGVRAGMAFFTDAIKAIKASPILADVPLYDLTGVPRAATTALATDYANIHPYPKLGRQPYNLLSTLVEKRLAPGKGVVITETGYHTGSSGAAWEAVDEVTQAKLTLNLLADAARLGVAATYLYDLADKPDPLGTSVDANLGLFDKDLRPKLAATAIHNLTEMLADSDGDGTTAANLQFEYAVAGLPKTGASLLLEKSDGRHALLVWAEPDIWNEVADAPIAAPVSHARLTLGGLFDVRVYDALVSSQALATYSSVSAIDLDVVDHPVVVEVAVPGSFDWGAGQTPPKPLTLVGGAGPNVLQGFSGNDTLNGLAGNDVLRAGLGDDVLSGGAGADTLVGGGGADTFRFNAAGESTQFRVDHILDFVEAEGDRIDLSRIDAMKGVAGNQAFNLAGSTFSSHAGELVQVPAGNGILLLGDVSGDGKADFAVMLHNLTQPLTSDAFLF